jgi:hypothetical protein
VAQSISSATNPKYDILIDDADGRHLCLESVPNVETGRERLPALATLYPGTRLILRNTKTQAVVATIEGY